ncbi:MAG: hypothetical protein RLP44_03940 [Aggregatilineales bacterium]
MLESKQTVKQSESSQNIHAMSAGVFATIFMTIAMYAGRIFQFPHIDIFHILGNLFTTKYWMSTAMGVILHFLSGAVFSLSYVRLWQSSVGKASYFWGFVFGAIHGVLANLLLRFLLPRHPRPAQTWDSSNSLVYIFTHLVFGVFVVIFYQNDATKFMEPDDAKPE